MRWIVVGAGAIGGGLGGGLARAGHDVHLVARGAHLATLQAGGLRWRTPTIDETLDLPASLLSDVTPGDDDVVCIATKLQDAESALAQVRDRWIDVPVVTWTNGVLAHRWAMGWASTVVATVQFVPASAAVPGEVRLWGSPHSGAVHAGTMVGDDGVRDALVAGLAAAGFVTRAHEHVAPILHTKWVRNLAGAVQALVVPEDRGVLYEAVQAEGRAVLEAAGLPLGPEAELLPVPMTLGRIDGEERGGGSTWQSLRSGRPLETAYLAGPILDLARAHGVEAPLNAWLVAGAERAMTESWGEGRLRWPA